MTTREEIALWNGGRGELAGWTANAAPGSSAKLAVEEAGTELRFDYSLVGHGAWAIARRELPFELPSHYVVSLVLRGKAVAPHELQLKLVDPSGANVWWWRLREFSPPPERTRLVLRRASLEFAWGPRSGGDPDRVGAVELAVASDRGAAGTLWIEELRVEPRQPATGPARARAARASSALPGHEASRALERDEASDWCPAPDDGLPWLELDLGEVRECGGLAVDFAGVDDAPPSRVLASLDGARWTPLAEDPGGGGTRRWIRTGEADARFVRLELDPQRRAGVARADVVPIELAVSPARFAASLARAAPRGRYPRHLLGEHAYWAVVGGDGDERKGLLGADGALEVDAEGFTLEPFLWSGGRLLSWADVELGAALEEGSLPIPSVVWDAAGLRLRITAFADGAPRRSALVALYEVESTDGMQHDVRLFVAVRPFQVTPAWQALNLTPAVAPIERLGSDGPRVRVDGREVIAVSAPDGFGAARGDEGLAALWQGRLPERPRVHDPLGFAEGALAFDLRVAPAGAASVVVAVPLFAETPVPPA
ncbi:MAG TPA: discoidin domain-containing protein, partial [Myxococcota bacterium]|nr:discoidin domain-containing protein [Myxococcota bacterium]